MTSEIRQMIRLATGGALIGGGIGGTLFSLISAMLVGLQPVVFIACGVYAGMVYGGVVGAVLGARDPRVESEAAAAGATQRTPAYELAVVRSRVG
jgi:hypothetical protein